MKKVLHLKYFIYLSQTDIYSDHAELKLSMPKNSV